MDSAVTWKRVSLLMMLLGAVGAGAILLFGEDVLGTTDGVPWGSLIATYLFFAAASVGLTLMASLWYVFGVEAFKPLTKRALYLAIISVLMGFGAIGLELGRPLNMFWLIFSPNFSSAIWWMGTLYAVYLGFRILCVYCIYKNDERKVLTFSRITVVAGLLAVSNLGSVFGNAQARPFWQGAAMPIYFIIVALLTGAAILIITFAMLEKAKPLGSGNGEALLPLLGRLLLYFVVAFGFFKFWYLSNSIYGVNPGTYEGAKVLLSGPLSLQFWVMEVGLAIMVPLFLLARPNSYTNGKLLWAALISLAGVFFAHQNFVLAGQLAPLQVIPGDTLMYQQYQAMPAEWSIIIGGIGALIYFSLWVEQKYFRSTAAA
ncbi:MAG: polysulfide reductase NrfD [Clostridia bacterium]|nr:polysulfide reductase NrfD [Clostridia bacterium]